jgi:hypothetical protein
MPQIEIYTSHNGDRWCLSRHAPGMVGPADPNLANALCRWRESRPCKMRDVEHFPAFHDTPSSCRTAKRQLFDSPERGWDDMKLRGGLRVLPAIPLGGRLLKAAQLVG